MLTRETIVAAINSNDPAEIKKLQEQGLKLIWQDDRGTTLLHFAASEGKEAIVAYLLKQKIHPDKPYQYTTDKQDKVDFLQRTPLLCAVTLGHIEVVKLLLAAGADIRKKNAYGFSPYSVARSSEHPNAPAIRKLFKNSVSECCNAPVIKESPISEYKAATTTNLTYFKPEKNKTPTVKTIVSNTCTII